ncbi:class 1 fructose-bisphosphatase [Halalkalicoccus jeotgali]|uniref:Fructose-1,6-bisphosphatase class 1 n=1 Tax=Halalkalicoccus jeotgali (strain DSM 18796 / CECT 7217 / JCM 14584 / KCTC 4019 / B3) TaxID=795797 RepID=D8J5H6_HALJB|nr:fructose-bisphosphatase class I [Halalkalicoccus jeotgali]ADJ15672.1 fructose-1,6-bisphosphatase [Halalkalicoccus jeotgali B3]ELY36558.1 fructose-1,6-bisphosphatase [Halalkalicoccus jeotgali B3]
MSEHSDTVEEVFETVARTAPEIRSALPGRRAETAGKNPSGELRLAADDYADDLLEERLGAIEGVGQYASEETKESVDTGEGLAIAVDPLDGSSNLKPNNTMGTIVGIYNAPLPAAGHELVGATYVLYGPITTMAAAAEGEVTEYVVTDGEREAVREDLTLPEDPAVYGFGGRVPDWTEDFAAYVEEIESDESLRLRYGGSMIGDVNQVLTYGGIFAYPALESAPEGKLRLQFEGNPVGYIVETAGGRSSDGEGSILEVDPEDLHERVPVYVGSTDLIDRLEGALN